jgi:hypothetical protein
MGPQPVRSRLLAAATAVGLLGPLAVALVLLGPHLSVPFFCVVSGGECSGSQAATRVMLVVLGYVAALLGALLVGLALSGRPALVYRILWGQVLFKR